MTAAEIQRLLLLFEETLASLDALLNARSDNLGEFSDDLAECCNTLNGNLDDIIETLSNIEAEYTGVFDNFVCQQYDPTIETWEIVFENYLCKQEVSATTTTTTAAATTTTTVDPDLEEWEIVFENYLCQADPSVTLTTTLDLKSGEFGLSGTFIDFVCAKEDCPSCTTTSTTAPATTTTTSATAPWDVEFIGAYADFVCEQWDNPLIDNGVTTTTTSINEDDYEFEIAFIDYLCKLVDVTTTTSTTTLPGTTTTTTAPATTTTTTYADSTCGDAISGGTGFPLTYFIDLGSGTGEVALSIDATAAPDKFMVYYEGVEVINTGYRGDAEYQTMLYAALNAQGASPEVINEPGTGVFTFNKNSTTRYAKVLVYAPLDETEWSFTLSCVGLTTTTTAVPDGYYGTYDNFECELTLDGTTTTTEPATTTTTGVPAYTVTCGNAQNGEQTFPTVFVVIGMGAGTGYVTLTYDTIEIPDRFVVEIDGTDVLDTGYRGDVNLQDTLDAALASYGEPSSTIIAGGSGTARFYKSTTSTLAIVKVWAPIAETQWSFTLSCPDDTITTTTTVVATTTTTTAGPTTTTTTPIPAESQNNAISHVRSTCSLPLELTPSDFPYDGSDIWELKWVKITGKTLAGTGTLTYDGVAVTDGQQIKVYGGATGSFLYPLVYTPDSSQNPFSDIIDFLVKTNDGSGYV